ncbi:MAG TPA: exosortase/archaeosortase family protein [Candidatus Acidoferrum sp.]|nr:exosortase/archaeosortase family protein [Candidatus Acidoferrum sp.]
MPVSQIAVQPESVAPNPTASPRPFGFTPRARVLVQAIVIGCLLALLYHGILRALVAQWIDDPNYSHGFFILLFCAWILQTRRADLRSLPRKPSSWGLVVIVGALAILILGVFGAEIYLSRTSLLFLIAGMTIYFAGWKIFRTALLPWGLLFLAIPLPAIIFNQITFPLQFGASRMAASLLALLGVPVLRQGNIIMLPALTLDVAEACSGLRSLMALFSIGVIYGCIFERKASNRVLLALAAIPIAVAANAIRIVTTGLLGQYWEPDKAEGFFHLFSGAVIFVCTLLLLFAFHAALKRFGRRSSVQPS